MCFAVRSWPLISEDSLACNNQKLRFVFAISIPRTLKHFSAWPSESRRTLTLRPKFKERNKHKKIIWNLKRVKNLIINTKSWHYTEVFCSTSVVKTKETKLASLRENKTHYTHIYRHCQHIVRYTFVSFYMNIFRYPYFKIFFLII